MRRLLSLLSGIASPLILGAPSLPSAALLLSSLSSTNFGCRWRTRRYSLSTKSIGSSAPFSLSFLSYSLKFSEPKATSITNSARVLSPIPRLFSSSEVTLDTNCR